MYIARLIAACSCVRAESGYNLKVASEINSGIFLNSEKLLHAF
jgi:hypothetical protein